MAKRYLSLEEAAKVLGMPESELSQLREKGDIRAFADRGTWKFREDEVQELMRKREADSGSDVGLSGDLDSALFLSDDLGSSEEIRLSESSSGDQPTVVRKSAADSGSDSDVRLVLDESLMATDGSSQELALARDKESDSDVRLAPDSGAMSHSDVMVLGDSASDVKTPGSSVTLPGTRKGDSGSDSDVTLVKPKKGNVADDESITLAEVSGHSDSDSGISLETGTGSSVLLDEEGITIDTDSGIALASPTDSGIALEGKPGKKKAPPAGTIPMIPAMGSPGGLADTSLEVPLLNKEDSGFEFASNALDDDSSTNVSTLDSDSVEIPVKGARGAKPASEAELTDSIFEPEAEEDVFAEDDDLQVADDIVGEDDEVFGADDADFDEGLQAGHSHAEIELPMSRMAAPVEVEWGAGVFVGTLLASLLLLVNGWVLFDLAQAMHSSSELSGPTGALLSTFKGMFGS